MTATPMKFGDRCIQQLATGAKAPERFVHSHLGKFVDAGRFVQKRAEADDHVAKPCKEDRAALRQHRLLGIAQYLFVDRLDHEVLLQPRGIKATLIKYRRRHDGWKACRSVRAGAARTARSRLSTVSTWCAWRESVGERQ
jgi:hypothetical protein